MSFTLKMAIAIGLIVAGLMLIVHAGVSPVWGWLPRMSAPWAAFLGAIAGVLLVVVAAAIGIMWDDRRALRRMFGDE